MKMVAVAFGASNKFMWVVEVRLSREGLDMDLGLSR